MSLRQSSLCPVRSRVHDPIRHGNTRSLLVVWDRVHQIFGSRRTGRPGCHVCFLFSILYSLFSILYSLCSIFDAPFFTFSHLIHPCLLVPYSYYRRWKAIICEGQTLPVLLSGTSARVPNQSQPPTLANHRTSLDTLSHPVIALQSISCRIFCGVPPEPT